MLAHGPSDSWVVALCIVQTDDMLDLLKQFFIYSSKTVGTPPLGINTVEGPTQRKSGCVMSREVLSSDRRRQNRCKCSIWIKGKMVRFLSCGSRLVREVRTFCKFLWPRVTLRERVVFHIWKRIRSDAMETAAKAQTILHNKRYVPLFIIKLGNEIRQRRHSKMKPLSGSLPKSFVGDSRPLAMNIKEKKGLSQTGS